MGTPPWAVPSLDALLAAGIEVAAVVTNPDRPAGRGMKMRPSAVKERGLAAGLEVLQPRSARDPQLQERLSKLAPDAGVVVAYGNILPEELLEIPRLGFVNVHFSLLPAYRGAAPVQRALMDGVDETGVSIILLTEGMDEGPLLATESIPVSRDDTGGTVGDRLALVGAGLLVGALRAYDERSLVPQPQDDAKATYAPKIGREETRINWAQPSERVRNHVRALNPEPTAWTTLRGSRLRVHSVRIAPHEVLAPGAVAGDGGLWVGTADDPVELVEVQMAGKRRMSGIDLARGLRPRPGEKVL